jgi:hypothetical protein
MMTRAPTKPIPTAAQRRGPTFSPRKGTERAVSISGPTKPTAVASASGMNFSASQNSTVESSRKTERQSCNPSRLLRRIAKPRLRRRRKGRVRAWKR